MNDVEPIGFLARLWLAFVLPWRVLFDGSFAARVRGLDRADALPPAPAPAPVQVKEAEVVRGPDATAALQLLAALQREGRFVDFLEEDISGLRDADIGAAARVVHDGCKRALAGIVEIAPVRSEDEGAAIELPPGYDAARVRVTGNVVGAPPFKGTLAHHGWWAKAVTLPSATAGHDARVIAPAEVELSAS
ncbi:MAG: DUF2760 domain-containing protein [Deltaproteobacteria bacterium]|nr:DUF2760 domain-containing protein [Deltaproteobacteria bacterium]MBK8717659.1 DUF2760 domain-containing protein [Deltaproteobacteria bacterium]MBP7285734.1 DUF2760 domain-containing protein [Nannocystaceae bacterium]